MATVTEPVKDETETAGVVALSGVDWDGYKTLLRLRGERRRPKMDYLDGTVYLMSPSYTHERLTQRLGHVVSEIVVGLDVPCLEAGSTTFRRKLRRGGVEADLAFYLKNEALVRGKTSFHLKTDPPPDLVVEVVHSNEASTALEIHRRFRVPEVWVCDAFEFVILILDGRKRYRESAASLAFPFLSAEEVHDWVARPADGDSDTAWIKAFRAWVQETLKPRAIRAGRRDEPQDA